MIHTCLSRLMFFLLKYLDSFSVTRRAHGAGQVRMRVPNIRY